MKTIAAKSLPHTSLPQARRLPLVARGVLARLGKVRSGRLTLTENGRRHELGLDVPGVPAAFVEVRDERFWSAVALRGGVGAGEAYAQGWWHSDAPTDVVRLFVRNREVLEGLERGLARLSKPLLKAAHLLRRNTERGSRANISAHYDLSNEFFALFLDPTMTYSCGIFADERTTLEEASLAKIDRLCRKLELHAGDHLLEIGTGWGAFALHAAREYGCRVTTTTISEEQHAYAAERFAAAGMKDRIELVFQDYRKLEGQYDKLVSVEMIEAVGHEYFGAFFEQCGRLLKPDGLMALQAITITDSQYDVARKRVDFIREHIFPGCCIPSVTALSSAMARSSDLKPTHMEDIGPHYATTLAAWRKNLRARWDEARAAGHTEEFLRLWEFYFAYCEGGFAERYLGDVQLLLAKPGARHDPLAPRI